MQHIILAACEPSHFVCSWLFSLTLVLFKPLLALDQALTINSTSPVVNTTATMATTAAGPVAINFNRLRPRAYPWMTEPRCS